MKSSIRNRRQRKKINRDFDLQLTSMMDMLIILVVFLLKSYAANSVVFNPAGNINLPVSVSEDLPSDSLHLIVQPNGIVFDNEKILSFKMPVGMPADQEIKAEQATYEIEGQMLGDGGRRIVPLYDAMVKAREKAEVLMSKAQWKDSKGNTVEPPKFEGIVVIQADKAVRYELLRKLMYTAGAAQFKIFKLVTVKKETG